MRKYPMIALLLAIFVLVLMNGSSVVAEQTKAKQATQSSDTTCDLSKSQSCCPGHQPNPGCCSGGDKAKCDGAAKCEGAAKCGASTKCAGKADACKGKAACTPKAECVKKSTGSDS